jgi:hypothetical protein
MEASELVVLVAWVTGVAVAASACTAPQHPSNPAAIDELCLPACALRHGCDPAEDYASCVNYCRNFGSPRRIYERPDIIASERACLGRTACGPDLSSRISTACYRDVLAAAQPTALARSYCEHRSRKDFVCGVRDITVAKCLDGYKMYTDAILQQLDDCLGDASCRTYGRCLLGVVGPDQYWDEDRSRQWMERPVMTPPPTTVQFSGTVLLEGELPIAGGAVCVNDRPDIACSTTDAAGRFALTLPASQELAITVKAPGSVPELVPIRTGTHDQHRWSFGTQRLETQAQRFAAIDAPDPGPTTTSVTVYAHPQEGKGGFERIQLALTPASGTGPFYSESDGAPSRTRRFTSRRGSALFANVSPGVVELEVTPPGVTCVPGSAGWAAPRINQVRVPVRAGYETRVTLACHF